MKRRDFLTNTALIGAGIPLGMAPVGLSSCSEKKFFFRNQWENVF